MSIKPERISTFINFWINVVLCALLSYYVLSKNQALELRGFLISWVMSFGIGFTIGDLLPAPAWGDKLAKVFRLKENSFGYLLISSLVIAVCMITCISLVMTWMNAPAGVVIPAWLSVLPFLLISGFILELIMIPILKKIAFRLAGIPSTPIQQ